MIAASSGFLELVDMFMEETTLKLRDGTTAMMLAAS